MTERARLIEAFLETAGWGSAQRRLLAADASFRRYERLSRDTGTAVLMDAPPPHENVAAFNTIARQLLDLGLSAPRPVAVDEAAGLMLLEDLGDRTFTRALAEGIDEARLYPLAVDVLIALHQAWRPNPQAALPTYDDSRLLDEAALLPDWTLPALRGAETAAETRESYRAAWRAVLPRAHAVSDCLVLRDYHVDNLMLLDGRENIAACGLLDFQDAVIGPRAYDLVSLLEDARRDIAPDLAAAMLERYLAAFPDVDRAAFLDSYAVLGAQRAAKIIGIFTRLDRRDGKPAYLRHIPRVWRLLQTGLAKPALAPVRAWFDRHVPAAERIAPPPRKPAPRNNA
jgi:N-acetylmuramate 1-kinase